MSGKLSQGLKGTVYLLHFDKPLHHARHYIGWVLKDVATRIQKHVEGNGSPLVKAVIESGNEVRLARVWPGADRNIERRLKNGKDTPTFCPLCSGQAAYNRRKFK